MGKKKHSNNTRLPVAVGQVVRVSQGDQYYSWFGGGDRKKLIKCRFWRWPDWGPNPAPCCVTWTRRWPHFLFSKGQSQQPHLEGSQEGARKELTARSGLRLVSRWLGGCAHPARTGVCRRDPGPVPNSFQSRMDFALKELQLGNQTLRTHCQKAPCQGRGADKEAMGVRGPCRGGN